MERSGLILTAFHWAGWLCWSYIGGAPTVTAERLCCWTSAECMGSRARVCARGLRKFSNPTTPFHRTVSGWLACGGWGMGFVSAVISLCSHSGFKCVLQMDHDYLACLVWLAHWLSLCNIGDQPGLLSQAISRVQQVPQKQAT